MRIKTSGIIPIKPWNEFFIIAGKILVLSLMAVGDKSMKRPILQISRTNKNGIILSKIEGTLIKYFWSNFGPQA